MNKGKNKQKAKPKPTCFGCGLPAVCSFMCKVGIQRESQAFEHKLSNGNAVKL